MKPHSLCHAFLLKELLQTSTSSVGDFFCCEPRSGEQIQALTLYNAVRDIYPNTDSLSQNILVLKGTNHQMSVYDKIPILYVL
jgi:hypothetical protein